MIINIEELLSKGYLKQVDGGYLLNPKAPNDLKRDLFDLNEEYYNTFGTDVIFFGKTKDKELTEDMAMDDRWITIGHRDGNGEDDEGRKGRHILLKEGETPTEAIERTTGTDIDKDGKVGKKDEGQEKKEDKNDETKPEPKPEEKKEEPKEEPKKEEKPEAKPEPKEEKKDPGQEKTPAIEYAELLDKEKSGGLSDSEKARKKELEEKEGFGEKETPVKEMSDEQLKKREDELDQKYSDFLKRKREAIKEAKEGNKELTEAQKKYEEAEDNYYKAPMYTDEKREYARQMDDARKKVNELSDSIYDKINKQFKDEEEEISKTLHEVQMESWNRENKREEASLEKSKELGAKLDSIMTKADDMTEEEFIKSIEALKEETEKAGLYNSHRNMMMSNIELRSGKAMFNKKAATMGEKLKSYSSKTDSLIKDFENFDDPYKKYNDEKDQEVKELDELRSQRDKEQDPEKKKKLGEEVIRRVLNSHFVDDRKTVNKVKYERNMAVANVLRKQNNTGTQVVAGKSTIKGIFDKLNGVFGGVIGKNISTDNAPNVQALRGRAYYSASKNIFKVEKDADFGDVIHEYTHFLERNNPKMLANSLAFAEYRTKGEESQQLSKLTGNSYGADEIAKKDRFFSPYCGKIYSYNNEYRTGNASEIMSMGVERLFKEPAKFAKEDREYFDFVVANLRGEL